MEDVESDDEDDDDDTAPQTNTGSDVEQDESGAEAPQMGRGQRVRTPPDYYQADHTNIRYAYPGEADVIHTCFQGAGYRAKSNPDLKQDFVNVAAQIDSLIDENPPPVSRSDGGTVRRPHYGGRQG